MNIIKRTATFDLETNGLLKDATKIWCAVIRNHNDNSIKVFTYNNINNLPAYLTTFDYLIGHNCIAFDFPILKKILNWEFKGRKIDTLIMSRTQRPNRRAPKGCTAGPHSVAAWGIRLKDYKIDNDIWDKYSDKILERCKKDVEIQYEIYHALLEEGKGEGWEHAHRLNNKLFECLQKQEENGWLVDRELIDGNISTLNRWINKIDNSVANYLPLLTINEETKKNGVYNYVKKPFKKDGTYSLSSERFIINCNNDNISHTICGPFSRITIRPISLDSNLETKNFLLSLGWKPKEYNYNIKGEQTSPKLSKDDPFDGIQGSLGKLIAKRVICKHRRSSLEGWIEVIRPDGRISAAVTGIASTGRLRHKTIVNVPSPVSGAWFAKQMRKVFITKPEWVIVGVDSKGNQIRQLASRMGDKSFTKAVLFGTQEEGTDLHSLNQKLSGAATRTKAKNFFYGLIFGAKAKKISETLGISFKKAEELITNYLNELPLLKKCIDDLTIQWKSTAQIYFDPKFDRTVYRNGKIKGLDGRPIYIDTEHKILNYMLQSDEAIHMSVAYVIFHHWMEKKGFILGKDWNMLIFMHDEFQFEIRPDIAEKAGNMACKAITWAGKYFAIKCLHEGEYKIGKNWYETH